VWGIARFTKPARKKRLDEMGVHTRMVDLMNPDFSELPEDFDHVIHLGGDVCQGDERGIYMPNGASFFLANQVNGIGTGKVMSRFRYVESILVVSTTGVFKKRDADKYDQAEVEDGLLGPFHDDAPQYSASKNAQEVIARFCAEEFGVPTTIARLGCQVSPIEEGLVAFRGHLAQVGHDRGRFHGAAVATEAIGVIEVTTGGDIGRGSDPLRRFRQGAVNLFRRLPLGLAPQFKDE